MAQAAAVTLVQSLTQEFPHATGAAKNRKEKKKFNTGLEKSRKIFIKRLIMM